MRHGQGPLRRLDGSAPTNDLGRTGQTGKRDGENGTHRPGFRR
jgi:hypothetical protein